MLLNRLLATCVQRECWETAFCVAEIREPLFIHDFVVFFAFLYFNTSPSLVALVERTFICMCVCLFCVFSLICLFYKVWNDTKRRKKLNKIKSRYRSWSFSSPHWFRAKDVLTSIHSLAFRVGVIVVVPNNLSINFNTSVWMVSRGVSFDSMYIHTYRYIPDTTIRSNSIRLVEIISNLFGPILFLKHFLYRHLSRRSRFFTFNLGRSGNLFSF